MKAIYPIVSFCLRSAQPVYFRRIVVDGAPCDDPREHLLVVANHPYGIQDAFLITVAYSRPFYFVATALNFQRRVGDVIKRRWFRGWFLTQCQVLPLVRDRKEGHMSDNIKTIQSAAGHIADGHALGIFAEGDSRGNQWKLLKLKSGAAQIALEVAERIKERDRCLKIQIVGITYTNWDEPFKSTVTLKCAEPFRVEPVEMTDKRAVKTARKELTAQMTSLMQQVTVSISDKDQRLVGKIGRFYCPDNRNDYERLTMVKNKVAELLPQHADERADLEDKLDEYLALSDELKVYPGEERVNRNPWLLLAAAIPAYLGFWLHWPIMQATRAMVPRETTVLHALGSLRVTWAIGFTLLWYAAVGVIVTILTAGRLGLAAVSLALMVLVTMGLCGLLASRFFRHVNLLRRSLLPSRRRFRRYRELGQQLYEQLEGYRTGRV